jgi:deoxyribodipyrimidine photo-lyase
MRTLVWFRGKDLRVRDHQALYEAAMTGEVIPCFVVDPYFFSRERACELPHRMQFLIQSLAELQVAIQALGSQMVFVSGKSVDTIPRLVNEWNVDKVVAHRWVEPFGRERDRRIKEALGDRFELVEGEMLAPPESVRNKTGGSYGVFSPFAKAFRKTITVDEPLPVPDSLGPLPSLTGDFSTEAPTLASVGLEDNSAVIRGGERAARERLRTFLADPIARYDGDRNRMDLPGTSRLSADLKFGTLSVRSVWRAVTQGAKSTKDTHTFLNEILWREFAHSTLWDRPEILKDPYRPAFKGFPWRKDPEGWAAWTAGRTGYPVVDASARQLVGEGFVHNRARMISASFLTKHLLVHYKEGEAHYLKYLVDGDWAQNNAGWQWSAGCGCDGQPYFRVFNPFTQGERFDPQGSYVRRWVPELRDLPDKYIHRPWEAPTHVLAKAGVVLDETYPRPIVEHAEARKRYLALAKGHLKSPQGADG